MRRARGISSLKLPGVKLQCIAVVLGLLVVAEHSNRVFGATNEPWNQPGSNHNPSNQPHGQHHGGTLKPQRDVTTPTTLPPTTPTPTSYNSTGNSTQSDFNTIIPNTNIDEDELTDSTKESTSMKPSSKAPTVDSSLVSPEVSLDLNTTEEELPTTTDLLTSRTASLTQPSLHFTNDNTTVQMMESITTLTASPTTPTSTTTTIPMTSNHYSATSSLLVTQQNATSAAALLTRQTTTLDTFTQQSTASPSPSTTKISTPAMSTTDHSISTPLQRTSIPMTPQTERSSTRNQSPISVTSTSRRPNSTPQPPSTSTARILTAHTSTQSSIHNHSSVVVVTKAHQHGAGKITRQPDAHQEPSAEPEDPDYQIAGDQNDLGLPFDSEHPKDDPSGNHNIPINNYRGGTTGMTTGHTIYPPVYIQLVLIMSSSMFCQQRNEIKLDLAKVAKDIVPSLSDIQAEDVDTQRICDFGDVSVTVTPDDESVTIEFYFTVAEEYDANTTRKVGDALEDNPSLLNRYITVKVSAVYILGNSDVPMPTLSSSVRHVNTLSIEISVPLSLVLLVIAGVAGFVIYKAYKLRVARQTYKDRYYFDGNQLQDSMTDTQTLRPKESKAMARLNLKIPAINQGLELDEEPEDIALQVFPSHILSINALAKFYTYIEAIVQEFQTLPDFQAVLRNKPPPSPLSPRRLAATLPGHQFFDKRHHHSFQYPTKTQVKLERVILGDSPQPLNANFVMGHNESSCAYIACQAPQTAADEFWHMVWEQQSKTIILLCAPEEMGTRYCWYWPKDIGIQSAQLYGDILVMLQGQVRTENYIMSTLLIKDIQKNLCRPVIHCWFCQWPEIEIPINPKALIVFLMQVRQTYQENPGPIVVQCSDGCGRTGTLIAIDVCMQSLEDLGSVDIPTTVSNVRQDRGSAVHNREQYSFIYKVLYEYSTMLIASGCPESNFMPQPHATQSMPLRVMYQ